MDNLSTKSLESNYFRYQTEVSIERILIRSTFNISPHSADCSFINIMDRNYCLLNSINKSASKFYDGARET